MESEAREGTLIFGFKRERVEEQRGKKKEGVLRFYGFV
jgi:hypothetical protein